MNFPNIISKQSQEMKLKWKMYESVICLPTKPIRSIVTQQRDLIDCQCKLLEKKLVWMNLWRKSRNFIANTTREIVPQQQQAMSVLMMRMQIRRPTHLKFRATQKMKKNYKILKKWSKVEKVAQRWLNMIQSRNQPDHHLKHQSNRKSNHQKPWNPYREVFSSVICAKRLQVQRATWNVIVVVSMASNASVVTFARDDSLWNAHWTFIGVGMLEPGHPSAKIATENLRQKMICNVTIKPVIKCKIAIFADEQWNCNRNWSGICKITSQKSHSNAMLVRINSPPNEISADTNNCTPEKECFNVTDARKNTPPNGQKTIINGWTGILINDDFIEKSAGAQLSIEWKLIVIENLSSFNNQPMSECLQFPLN